MPHWPWGANLRLVPSSVAVSFFRKANRTFLVIESGSFWPCSSLSLGLGSNRSTWLGAPSMKMKMQALARAGKCGALGCSGSIALLAAWADFAPSSPSSAIAAVSAKPPKPLAAVVKN